MAAPIHSVQRTRASFPAVLTRTYGALARFSEKDRWPFKMRPGFSVPPENPFAFLPGADKLSV